MNTLDRKRRLNDLKDQETRQIVYSEYIAETIPIQIRELRKKWKYTQKQLAELLGVDQSSISDWENPNYEWTPQIGTLERFANAFDVPLIVRFGSWPELWNWEHNLTSDKLAPKSFEEALPELIELSEAADTAVTFTRPISVPQPDEQPTKTITLAHRKPDVLSPDMRARGTSEKTVTFKAAA